MDPSNFYMNLFLKKYNLQQWKIFLCLRCHLGSQKSTFQLALLVLFLLGSGICLGFVASVVIDVQPSLFFMQHRPGILIENEHCLPSLSDILDRFHH